MPQLFRFAKPTCSCAGETPVGNPAGRSARGQALFRRLAVFAGSFTLEAAEAIAGADVDTLQSLVEKSLVRRWGSGRLGMLETVRELALERLESTGEGDALRQRHLEHLVGVGEAARMYSDAEQGEERLDLIAPERDNVRAALEWALAAGEIELGSRLAVALEDMWVAADPFEGARWFARFLERSRAASATQRACLLRAHGGMIYIVGRFEEGARRYQESIDLYRELGDEEGVAIMLPRLAIEANRVGDLERAQALAEESLTLHRARGSRWGEAQSLSALATVAWANGERERALELEEGALAAARDAGFLWWQANTLLTLGEYALELGRAGDAARRAAEGLELASRLSDRQNIVWALALLARASAESGDSERAGRLWGALEAEEGRGEIGQWEQERHLHAEALLSRAGPDFERGRAVGRALALDEAIAGALVLG